MAYQTKISEESLQDTLFHWLEGLLQGGDTVTENFTDRELEVMGLIGQGLRSCEIADRLFISEQTVHTHRKNIYRKGNFNGLRDVVIYSLVKDFKSYVAKELF